MTTSNQLISPYILIYRSFATVLVKRALLRVYLIGPKNVNLIFHVDCPTLSKNNLGRFLSISI